MCSVARYDAETHKFAGWAARNMTLEEAISLLKEAPRYYYVLMPDFESDEPPAEARRHRCSADDQACPLDAPRRSDARPCHALHWRCQGIALAIEALH